MQTKHVKVGGAPAGAAAVEFSPSSLLRLPRYFCGRYDGTQVRMLPIMNLMSMFLWVCCSKVRLKEGGIVPSRRRRLDRAVNAVSSSVHHRPHEYLSYKHQARDNVTDYIDGNEGCRPQICRCRMVLVRLRCWAPSKTEAFSDYV